MTEPTETAAPAASPSTIIVPLNNPIQREGGAITALTLRKPKGGELMGLNIQNLMVGDVTAVITVLPRITTPIITGHEARMLEAEDIAELAGTVQGFFLTSAQKKAMAQLMGG